MASQDQTGADSGSHVASDYLDLDQVDLSGHDIRDVDALLNLSDQLKDKLSFTAYMMNICVTCFMVGYLPKYFYIWYTLKAVVLLSYRWYSYKKLSFHYFLFDFCYFTNSLVLLYVWSPGWLLPDHWRGALFVGVFSFSMGPLLSAIILWKNSLVPHSNDKMTSIFIHVSPAMAVWSIRWHSSEDQGFPLCVSHDQVGCSHVTMRETVLLPLLLYWVWQVFYILVVFVWREQRIKERRYATGYSWLVERSRQGLAYRLCTVFGERYKKPMFVLFQFIYTSLSVLPVSLYYHCELAGVGAVWVVMTFACYNGACFYIDVFSHRYYFEKVLHIKPPSAETLARNMAEFKKDSKQN